MPIPFTEGKAMKTVVQTVTETLTLTPVYTATERRV